jgi:hypothetical protein
VRESKGWQGGEHAPMVGDRPKCAWNEATEMFTEAIIFTYTRTYIRARKSILGPHVILST